MDYYTEELEMRLRFAEEDALERESFAYEQGRRDAIEEFRTYLKTVTPCEMPQGIWNIGVDNTCDRMMKGETDGTSSTVE